MPLDPDDATPHDGPIDPADHEAALRTHVRMVQAEPLRTTPAEVLLGHLQNMILTAARASGGTKAVNEANAELATLAPDTAREFTERVRHGYGRGTKHKIGELYCQFLADRIAETCSRYRAQDPRSLHILLKMATETLLLQDVQAQRLQG